MKQYEAYKDSGVEWLGEIPEHWEVKKLKYLGIVQPSNVDKKKAEGEIPVHLCNYIDVYKNEFIEDSLDFMEATATEDEILKFKINIDDVLVTKDSESADDIAIPALVKIERENLICGYHLTQIKSNPKELKGSFLFRLFQENLFKSQFRVYANGVTRFGLSVARFKDAFITLPPLAEQTSIASFLDRKTSQIDSLVEKKKRLIELLKEEKAAVINQAVTKGLDPNVKMKDSGVEWLGEIPEHWEVKKLKWVLAKERGALKPGPFGSDLKNSDLTPGGKFKVYTQRNVLDNDFDTCEDFINSDKYESLSAFKISPGDLLLTTRGTIGRIAKFPNNKQEGILHPCLIRLRVDETKITQSWLEVYCNQSTFFIENVLLNSNSTVINVIYGYTLSEIIIPIPPISEQKSLIDKLGKTNRKVDSTISKIEKEIELLQEYRTALVSEVVTGKVRV
ncbi:MAG: hypothetical protein GW761_14320 [Leptospira sp.]|nr:hypothetical protein [Leptospira sp.]